MQNISNELKVYELSLIWKEAEYNFAFWEKLNGTLDWDKAYKDALPNVLATDNLYDYYMELSKFLALLRDGHTNINFPQSVISSRAYLPVFFNYIDGKHIITHDHKSLNINQFLIVKKFNGVDIDEYIEKNILPYIWHEKYDSAYGQIRSFLQLGEENSEVELEVEEDGASRVITIKRIKNKMKWVYNQKGILNMMMHKASRFMKPYAIKIFGKKKLAPSQYRHNHNMQPSEELEGIYSSNSHRIYKTKDNIAVIVIDTFSNNKLGEEFYANQRILETMSGFIIDVRKNGGGNSDNADNVAKAFIDGEIRTGRDLKPIHIGTYKAWAKYQGFGDKTYDELVSERGYSELLEKMYKIPKHMYYEEEESFISHEGCPFLLNQPLVVLSSCSTGSAAEDFLITLDQANRVIIVGSASCGSTGQPLFVDLESGGSFRICTRNCTYPDGRQFIDIGVQPHIKCELTLDDYKNGVDSVMNKGLEEIRKLV